MQKNAQGNVLFLILIAVALFAALSYAVTQSNKGGGSGINQDKAKLLASEIAQYAASIEQAITRLMLMNNCTDTQISFDNTVNASSHVNPNAPTDNRCHVFHTNGGGISPRMFDNATHLHYATQTNIEDIGTNCGTAECAEIYFWMRTANDKTTCMAFNDLMKVDNISGDAPHAGGLFGTPFQGTHTFGNELGTGGNGPAFKGQRAGCHYDTNEFKYDFYYVFVAR